MPKKSTTLRKFFEEEKKKGSSSLVETIMSQPAIMKNLDRAVIVIYGDKGNAEQILDPNTGASVFSKARDPRSGEEMKDQIAIGDGYEKGGEVMENEEKQGAFDKFKNVDGIDMDILDRVNIALSDEEPEDPRAFDMELKSLIEEVGQAKGAADSEGNMELADAYAEIETELKDFSEAYDSVNSDIAYDKGNRAEQMGMKRSKKVTPDEMME